MTAGRGTGVEAVGADVGGAIVGGAGSRKAAGGVTTGSRAGGRTGA